MLTELDGKHDHSFWRCEKGKSNEKHVESQGLVSGLVTISTLIYR